MQFLKDSSVFHSYVRKLPLSARLILQKQTICDILSFVNLKVVFRIKNRLSSKFMFKEKISKEICFLLCWKFQCSSYNAIYYGKTKHHFKFRVSAPTGESIKSTTNSDV